MARREKRTLLDRVGGGLTGAFIGLVSGIAVAIFLVGFGDLFFPTLVVGVVAGFGVGVLFPPPFLFVLQPVLSIFGFEF